MPIYEYACQACGAVFAQRQPFSRSDQLVQCPECASKQTRKRLPNVAFISHRPNDIPVPMTHSGCGCGGGCACRN